MEKFLGLYAPFIVLIGSIFVAFWIGPKDRAVSREQKE
ncbi:cytochrome bd oxidase small subunit CydS [Cytobacillus dafuensis]